METEKPRIKDRFEKVYSRWRDLKVASEMRWKDLREAQQGLRTVDDLLLAFAKKAYEINSWFENAEEDMSDPVRCYSIEQINEKFKTQDEFLSRLGKINQDLEDIEKLDSKIKKLIFILT